MSSIVSKWLLHRLGMIIDMTPDSFAINTANGRLLAEILKSYEIITTEELSLIKDSDHVAECYENFKVIKLWLSHLNLIICDEDLYEIVHGIGSTSLHLFYQVFLELKDKTKLDFLTENEINAQLGKKYHRFYVKPIDDSEDPTRLDLHSSGLCEPFLAGGDVYHWYKDRIESLQNRCKDARDEYIHSIRNKCKSLSGSRGLHDQESAFVLSRGICVSPASKCDLNRYSLPTEDLNSLDERTYEDLVKQQKEAQNISPFKPNPKEVKKIMNNLHTKRKTRHENKILRHQLHQEIMNEFDRKINDSKAKSEDRAFISIFMKQSLYEKELVTKVGQVKAQKEYMVENKFKQGEILNKLKEKNFMEALLLKDKELNEKKLTYYLEQERILQLHRKIWEERLRLRAKRHQELCSSAVKDMVDIAMNIAEYKKRFGQEPNKREIEVFKNLFISGQPIFDICEPVIEIMKDNDDEIPEAIITREMDRQNELDEQEFDRYFNYEWPWELENVNASSETFHAVSYGLNILGYIIHRALLTKYPVLPIRETPEFPDANIRVCVNGLNDPAILPSLRNLLLGREITVIELSQAVEFCLDAYRQESIRELEDVDVAEKVKEGKSKKEKPPKAKKGEKSSKKKKGKIEENREEIPSEPIIQMENKLVQTPIKYPCEEIPYTPSALLGRTAQELLDEGKPLGDFLLVDMFIQYLKSIPNLKGWVLVNYPTTFEQAAILEEALTGIKLVDPLMANLEKSLTDIADNEQEDDKESCSLNENIEAKRASRLLPNPVVPEPVKLYETILTAYIKIYKLAYDDKTGNAQLPPLYEELGEEPDPLDRFYSNAGANYSLYYKEFDSTTVKYLGKLVIGDFSLPIKSSVELFGDLIDLDNRPSKAVKAAKKGDKIKKPTKRMSYTSDKTSMKVVAGKKDKKGKAKLIITFEDKGVQMPTEDEDEYEESDRTESIAELPTAGQPGWEYTNLNCPEELLIALATLWETVEEIYINDLKQVFFLKRLNMNSIMPFAQYVKDVMKKIIDRPDYRGFYLAKFQKAFNAFDMDFRKDDEFKAEMHCRIEDFKEKLAEMTDIKMMESENVRCRLIGADWAPRQITELINDYVNMMQIEIDRFIESIRFVNDYYLGIINGMPSEDDNYKEELIPKYREIGTDFINNIFEDSTSTVDLSYFDDLLSVVTQKVNACIKKINAVAASCMDKTKGAQTSNQKSKSKPSSPKSKASKDTKKTGDQQNTIIKDNYDKLMEEWQCAVKAETLRVSFRTDLIKYNALQSIEEFMTTVQHSFHEVYSEIRSKYWDEMENIQKACNVFRSAVENEEPLQKELLFEGHMFCINPEINLFDNPPIIPELPREIVEEGAFTIWQLSKLVDIFLDLSPKGYLPKSTFTFILQDIIWITPEGDSKWLAPKLWRKLDTANLRKVIDSLYDELEYVYWRDFIVHNIRVDYPTERELLLTRNALRECDPDGTELIQDYQFFATKLWFEYAFKQENTKRIMDIKRLLYKLYYIKNYGLNYTAMLLDFCKDERPLEGFAKALQLSIGKVVCWDTDIGRIFREEYLSRMQEHEESVKERDAEREDYYKAVYDELTKLVDYVVHITDDIIIEDVDYPKEPTPETSPGTSSRRGSILKKSMDGETNKRTSKDSDALRFKDTVEIAGKENSVVEEINSEESATDSQLHKSDSQVVKVLKDLPDNVGTECNEYTELIFFLPLDALITVITAALPWHSRVQNFGDLSYWEAAADIFEQCRNPDFNMAVLTHEYLNCDKFLDLLSMTKKFSFIDPVRVVNDILNECELM